ncbi:NAD(P)/FAD-dependent oxidoreductase [Paenibacillus ferrarius]|uniref:NAD(P)/FAD-dependent oxidoreductase n=1 Tax=Paenibacillus ferrarius TaxID=1469647 RepID=UPI003D28CB66
MIYDCAIIGGGPAGLNAALVLGRARRTVALCDNNRPRNRVTHASHGFITQDGVTPSEFRRKAYEDVLKYPSVQHYAVPVTEIIKEQDTFTVVVEGAEPIRARKVLLAVGLNETLPDLPGVKEVYGKSVFHCPYCDGWELRDQPLIAIGDHPRIFHIAKLLYGWSRDLVISTNGAQVLDDEQKRQLNAKGIRVTEQRVAALHSEQGKLTEVEWMDGTRLARSGGFVMPQWTPHTVRFASLGFDTNEWGGIRTNEFGESSVLGLFAAGEAATGMGAQLITAAASGSMAAMGVNTALMEEAFQE